MVKVLISAHEFKHAEYYAREVLHISRTQFKFIENDWDIRGQRGLELIIIDAPRHRPTVRQMENRYILTQVALAWGLIIKEVTLP